MNFPHFVGSAYRSQSVIAGSEELINFYVQRLESPGAKPMQKTALYPTPGLSTFANASGATPVRGLFEQDGRTFTVIAGTLREVNADGTLTSRGSVTQDLNPAQMVSNGDAGGQLFIVSGNTGYILTLSTNVLSSSVVTAARFAGFLDGFFLVLDTDTATLKISALENGLTWDAAQVAQRNVASDPWISMLVTHREIWLWGGQTAEVWYNAGTAPFPFEPIPGAFMEHGIAAGYSAAVVDHAPIWLGQNAQGRGIVWRAQGYGVPARVSTEAVEYAISRYTKIDDAVAFSYQDQGHSFYVLNFPSADATWVYDATTNEWHKRGAWDSANNIYQAYRPQYHCYAFNRHLVGDRASGKIYTMGIDLSTEYDGNGVRRLRRTPHLNNEGQWMFYSKLEIDLETGIGLTTGQGSAPVGMLRWSDDGGRTYGNEHQTSAGAIGKYRTRMRFQRLGRSRDRVWEFTVSDPIPWRIIQCYVDARVGRH